MALSEEELQKAYAIREKYLSRRDLITGAAALAALIVMWLASSADAKFCPLLCSGGVPYTYYVDSVNGKDTNSGTSITQAKQNITALPIITAGQSVCLVRGSYWRQQLTIAASNVTVSGCGNLSSPLPILDGSVQISNGTITKTGGFTNIYQTTTVTFTDGGDVSGWVNVFETGGPTDTATGSFLNLVASEAAVDTAPCSYFIPGMTPGAGIPASAIIYIHSCDGVAHGNITFAANPSNGDTITLNGVTWTFTTAANGTTNTQIRENLTATLDQLVTALDASANASLNVAHYYDTKVANALTVVYLTDGTGGNAYALAASAATPSASTLTGGQTASSPITNGYTYEYSDKQAGIVSSATNTSLKYIEARKAAYSDIFLQANGGPYYVNGMLLRDGGKHSANVSCGTTVVNSTFIDDYYANNGGNFLVFFDATGSGNPVVANNNIFEQSQWNTGNLLSSIIQHTNSGSCGAATHNGNSMIAKNGSNLSGIANANVTGITANNNVASQLSNFITNSQASQTYNMSGNQFVSSYLSNNFVLVNAANTTVNISNSKLCLAQISNGSIYSTQAIAALNLTGNLFYTNTVVNSFAIDMQLGGATALTSNGNDFGSAYTIQYYYNLFAASGSTFVGNNNIYEAVASNHWVLNNSGNTTLAAWQAAVSPQDAASVTTGGNAVSACTLPTLPSVQ